MVRRKYLFFVLLGICCDCSSQIAAIELIFNWLVVNPSIERVISLSHLEVIFKLKLLNVLISGGGKKRLVSHPAQCICGRRELNTRSFELVPKTSALTARPRPLANSAVKKQNPLFYFIPYHLNCKRSWNSPGPNKQGVCEW